MIGKGGTMKNRPGLVSLLAVLSVLVSACTLPAPTTPAPAAEGESQPGAEQVAEPAGDVLWWTLAEFDIEAHIDDLVAAYKEHSPNVNLELELLPEGAYFERLLPTLASGEGPDVFVNVVPRQTLDTATLDLTPYAEGANGMDLEQEFDLNALQGHIVDGKVYGLPRSLHGGHGWFINKDLFDQFGAAYPEDGWTWSDMLALAPQVTDKENRIYGIAISGVSAADIGFQPVSEDGRTVLGYMDSEEALTALRIWKQLYDCCSPTLDQQATEFQDTMGGGAGPLGAFISGRTAMATLGPAVYPLIEQAGINWDYVPSPLVDEETQRHKPTRFYVAWGINKNAQDPDAAWDFLKWLASAAGGQRFLAAAGYLTAARAPMDEAGAPAAILDVFFAPAPEEWGPPLPNQWSVPCFDEAGNPELSSTVDAILLSPESELEQILSEGAQRTQAAVDACWEKRETGQ
jgi:multiple sugar transport system substrate-binding protein